MPPPSINQIRIINAGIQEKKCILFLGPRFAMDNNSAKIHRQMRRSLSKKFELDQNFDNLYIFKDTQLRASQISDLKIDLCEFYSAVAANDIYDQICNISFRAIVSCTHDHFLPEAFQRIWKRPANFEYFSKKGQQVSETKQATGKATEGPILFNVFGSVKDKESLIVSHDSFYKFILTLIGDKEKIPGQLQTSLKESSVLLLFGFDLSKWYMPLFFRRLNEYINEGRDNDNPIVAYVNRDDTDDNINETDQQNAEMAPGMSYDAPPDDLNDRYYLNHFAINIENLECDTISFFRQLSQNISNRLQLSPLKFSHKRISDAGQNEKETICMVLEEVASMLGENDVEEAIDKLLPAYKPYEQEYNIVLNFKANYTQIKRNYAIDLDLGRKDSATARLRAEIISHCSFTSAEINCTSTTN